MTKPRRSDGLTARGARISMLSAALVAAVLVAPPATLARTSQPTARPVESLVAGNAATTSVDLSGTWAFTPSGRATTSITVPGGGGYKQGFTDAIRGSNAGQDFNAGHANGGTNQQW